MDQPATFLTWMGGYNVMGAVFLLACLYPPFANALLLKWTQILARPYKPTPEANLWLFWAAMLNVFFGLVNLFSANWEIEAQEMIIALDIGVYLVFLALTVFGLRSRHFGPGVWVCIPLFAFWMGWGILILAGA